MQFINTALSVLATVGVAQASQFALTLNLTATKIDSPSLDADDFFTNTVSYAKDSLYIGQISTKIYSEPFLASFGSDSIGFTSYHSSPTGFTSLYLYPNCTKPLGLTTPHSGYVPEEATDSGFGWGPDGYLTFGGENNFIGCEDEVRNSYQIYWLGDKMDLVDPPKICYGPLYLYRSNITTES